MGLEVGVGLCPQGTYRSHSGWVGAGVPIGSRRGGGSHLHSGVLPLEEEEARGGEPPPFQNFGNPPH